MNFSIVSECIYTDQPFFEVDPTNYKVHPVCIPYPQQLEINTSTG